MGEISFLGELCLEGSVDETAVVSASCLKGLFEKQLPYRNVILAELLQLNLAPAHLR